MPNLSFLRILSCLLLMVACASTGHRASQSASSPPPIKLTIVGTNDLHGWVEPHQVRLDDGQVLRQGGLAAFAGYLKQIRQENGDGVVLVDAGDLFQGTLIANVSEGEAVIEAYNALGYDAVAIGNHEFDYGPVGQQSVVLEPGDNPFGALQARTAQARFPMLARNTYLVSNGQRPNFLHPGGIAIIERRGLKIGLVGLVTPLTPQSTNPVNVSSLRFAPLAVEAQAAARELRERGADLLVALVHSGGACSNFDEPRSLAECNGQGEIFRMLNHLPPGLFDAVVAGHVHSRIGHFVNQMPVIESYAFGTHFGTIELTIDPATKKPLANATKISSGIPICERFFSGTTACDPKRQKQGPLEQATFHGQKVEPDDAMEALLRPFAQKVEERQRQSLRVKINQPLTRRYHAESTLGNALTDAVRQMEGSDAVLFNAGGLRSDLGAGDLTYGQLYQVMPFDNSIATLQVTGAQLQGMLEALVSTGHGAPQFSGLRVSMVRCKNRAKVTAISWADGRAFNARARYRLTTSDFLALGGDGVGPVVGTVEPRYQDLGHRRPLNMRDALAAWLSERKGELTAGLDGRMIFTEGEPGFCQSIGER